MGHGERARELLQKMNVTEKIAQLYAVWLRIGEDGSLSFRPVTGFLTECKGEPIDIVRNGVGHVTRPLGTRPIDARKGVRGFNILQKYLVEKTRLGIPALAHEECLPGLTAKGATLFPAGINFGSLWDEELMTRVASVIGGELYSVGSRQGLAPVLDVSRDARWGRTEETMGEDPYLVGCMAVAYVKGLQGGNRRVLATLKHYAGHSFGEGGRNHAPVRIGGREFNDVFLLPFEMAVKLADAGSVMPAYHDVDGEPLTSSREFLADTLRGRWGFDGLIVADYEAIRLLVSQHAVARDDAEACALALKAGVDVELPGFTCFRTGVEKALDRGILEMADVDAAVSRVLVEKSRLGLFENPYAKEEAIALNTEAHRAVAAEAAERSIVLLANDGILPLANGGTTALIGPLASDQFALFSGYGFPVHLIEALRVLDTDTSYAVTLKEALEERAGKDSILYSKGCEIFTERLKETAVFPGDLNAGKARSESNISADESGFGEALAVARRADRIIVAVGDLPGLFLTGTVGEGSDTTSLALPGVQQKLVDALLSLGKPTVIVLFNGRPYNLGSAFLKASAVVEAWLPGQEGASAVVRVLYGDINPGGRLPISFPRTAGAMPYFYNHKVKSGGSPMQAEFGAVFPFGYGLSYTTFAYGEFDVESLTVTSDGEITVSCSVENTGTRAGDEVVQLYIRDLYASFVQPVRLLKGFARVSLEPGERKRVVFSLPADVLGFSVSGNVRVVEAGDFEIMIGRSCDDILFRRTVEVTGGNRTLPPDWRMKTAVKVFRR